MPDAPMLSDLISEHCTALQTEKPADAGTRQRYRDPLDIMLQLLGDREAGGYSRQDLVILKANLYRWPAGITKPAEMGEKTAADILRSKPARTLDKRTVDSKYMPKISAVFQYAFRQGVIDEDISSNLLKTATVAEKKANKRKPYDIKDLQKIFATLPMHPERPHLAWIPLIAAFSGARAGEICGLRVTDVCTDRLIPYMMVNEEDDQGIAVKNLHGEMSRRLVPLHPLLVEMGLPAFVAGRAARGRELLFELQPKGDGEPVPLSGEYYGRSFEAFNRKQVTHDLRKGFRSFRCNVHQQLTARDVPPETCFALTGHKPRSDGGQTAAADERLTDLYRALTRLAYPGLELAGFREKLAATFV